MKNYYKIMLGSKSKYAEMCLNENFIGVDFGFDFDLSHELIEDWRQFNHKFIPVYQQKHPIKQKLQQVWLAVPFGPFAKG